MLADAYIEFGEVPFAGLCSFVGGDVYWKSKQKYMHSQYR